MASRTLSMIAVVSLSLFACGDDDDTGGGGETESSSTGDATGTQMSTTTMSATTMAMEGSSSEGGDTSGSDTGPAGSGDSTEGSGSGPMPMTDSGSETGVAGECGDLDMKACEMAEGCLWVGNANNGMCVAAGVRACELLLSEMICGMHPECVWDKAKMTCGGA